MSTNTDLVPRSFLKAMNRELNHRFHNEDMPWERAAKIIRTYLGNSKLKPKESAASPKLKTLKFGVAISPKDSPYLNQPLVKLGTQLRVNRVSDESQDEMNKKQPPAQSSTKKQSSKSMVI
jgi:hypothetical protein